MADNIEKLDVSGNLEIWKVYKDGTEEQVFNDHNLITSGMGVGLALLFAGSGADTITDYQIRWAQFGVSGNNVNADPNLYDASQYALVSALGQTTENVGGTGGTSGHYGVSPDFLLDEHDIMSPVGAALAGDNHWFLYIPQNAVKKSSPTSVTYSILLPTDACTGHILNEIGLFMHNPLAGVAEALVEMTNGKVRSPLVAYRPFVDILKTSDFALVFRWTISF